MKNLRTAVTAGLLLFVAASIATPIVRHLAAVRKEPAGDAAPQRPDALVVYYFRGNVRCTACRTLEACSHDVVNERFSAAAADGHIEWRAIDFQKPGNEHFTTDYQLLTGGVVLVAVSRRASQPMEGPDGSLEHDRRPGRACPTP